MVLLFFSLIITGTFIPYYRVFGWLVWLGSILLYLLCNIVFSVLIHLNSLRDSDGNPNQYLVVLRVVTLDGLFLLMGITLAVCMFIVSIYVLYLTL